MTGRELFWRVLLRTILVLATVLSAVVAAVLLLLMAAGGLLGWLLLGPPPGRRASHFWDGLKRARGGRRPEPDATVRAPLTRDQEEIERLLAELDQPREGTP